MSLLEKEMKWQVSKGNVTLVAMETISVPNLPADLSFQNHSSTQVPCPLQHCSDCIPWPLCKMFSHDMWLIAQAVFFYSPVRRGI